MRLPMLSSLAALLVGALPALAHSRPKVMVPAADSTVTAPAELSVTFTEALEGKFSSLRLTDASAHAVTTAPSVLDPADPKHLTLALPKLMPGVYTVHWSAAATDGHRSDGSYHFTVK